MDLLVNRAVESFSHSFQNGAAGKPNRLETLQTALESSYSQTPEAQTVNYARLGNIAEAAVGLGDKYQKVWAECLDTSMRDEVYLFSKKAGFPWSEADYDLPILNLILSVLPKDNLSFGQDSTFLRKVPLAIAVNYAQENAFSRRADVTILEANLEIGRASCRERVF